MLTKASNPAGNGRRKELDVGGGAAALAARRWPIPVGVEHGRPAAARWRWRMRLGRHPRKELEGDATGDGRHSSSSARLSSARGGDDAVDDLNTEHAGRFGRLRKEISGPINCTRLALMINLSSQLILIKVKKTHGVLQPYPLKRISSRDSERKTSKDKGTDQPPKVAGNSHIREDRC